RSAIAARASGALLPPESCRSCAEPERYGRLGGCREEHHAMDPALSRAVDWLLEHQDPAGWWCGEFETNVTITAEHILLLRFLGLDPSPLRDAVTRYLLGEQREDGSWALYYEGPADLSTSIEAYAALKVLGLDPTSEPMRCALQEIHDLVGAVHARVL